MNRTLDGNGGTDRMVQQYKHTRTLVKQIKKPLFGKYSKIFHFSPNSKPDVKSKPNLNLYLTIEDYTSINYEI